MDILTIISLSITVLSFILSVSVIIYIHKIKKEYDKDINRFTELKNKVNTSYNELINDLQKKGIIEKEDN